MPTLGKAAACNSANSSWSVCGTMVALDEEEVKGALAALAGKWLLCAWEE